MAFVFDAVRQSQVGAKNTPRLNPLAHVPPALTPANHLGTKRDTTPTFDRFVFSEDFAETTCCSEIEGLGPLPGIYNYFQDRDPRKWRTNVRAYSEVIYREVWPGIDVRISGNGPDLEQEFNVRPGADLKHIRMACGG
ncbi:MAG: hypothetical protein SGI92_26540 [Bryobacteraceae bacterium]|nr:hypothetical protein [Bryobacteraceae bacterium]